jgi:diaminohydroxyphosphoribosylaminopyrimidine deaminase/5-amino-6-(5-phosphoribosylamino)uracil reductase
MPLKSRVITTARDDLLVLCAFAEEKKRKALEAHGVRVEQVALPQAAPRVASGKVKQMPSRRRTGTGAPIHTLRRRASDGRPDLRKVMARLGEIEITSVLIEGGALVNWTALAAGVVDKIFLYYAPRILAGTGSVPFASGEGFQRMSDAATVQNVSIHHFGEDFAVEGYLRDPYGRVEGEIKAI